MIVSSDLEEFVHEHRPHGALTWQTTLPSPQGYRVEVGCPCGVVFERWVLPQDTAEGLLTEGLQGPDAGQRILTLRAEQLGARPGC